MASISFAPGLLDVVNNGLAGRTFTVMLLSAEQGPYSADENDQYVADLVAAESQATNYVRKVVTPTVQLDTLNSRVEVVIPDVTFSSLGGAANEDIEWAILFDDTSNDATAPLLVGWDLTGSTNLTNGTDFIVDFSAEGNWHFTY